MLKHPIELNTDHSQGINILMNKALIVMTVLILSISATAYSQENNDIDELYPMRKELADNLFPENQAQWSNIKEAFLTIKRELYIDENYRSVVYKNMPVPVKGGLIQPSPQFVAEILKESSIDSMSHVLVIGRNTRYFIKILSELTENLYVSDTTFVENTEDSLNLKNDLSYYGWVEEAPFDCIILFGSVQEIPRSLISQLVNGGKLIAPISYNSGSQVLISATRYLNGFDVKTIGESYIHSLR